jgi:hypothetical protein
VQPRPSDKGALREGQDFGRGMLHFHGSRAGALLCTMGMSYVHVGEVSLG